jgi:hypothetical protein
MFGELKRPSGSCFCALFPAQDPGEGAEPLVAKTSTMNPPTASFFVDSIPPPAAAPFVADTSSSRLAVAREMLVTLETLTNAGQRHLMAKVVTFIEGQVGESPAARDRQRATAAQMLVQLRRESDRPFPEVAAFRSRAEGLIKLLAPHE